MTALRVPIVEPDGFAGTTYARWVPPEQVRGQRIAVIGTAAVLSEIVPALVRTAEFVKVFQTEAAWANSTWTPPLPGALSHRLARLMLRRQVRDPWTRRQLTPIGARAADRSTADYLRAVQAPNCKLITWKIAAIVPAGIRTADGIEHHVDAIVIA